MFFFKIVNDFLSNNVVFIPLCIVHVHVLTWRISDIKIIASIAQLIILEFLEGRFGDSRNQCRSYICGHKQPNTPIFAFLMQCVNMHAHTHTYTVSNWSMINDQLIHFMHSTRFHLTMLFSYLIFSIVAHLYWSLCIGLLSFIAFLFLRSRNIIVFGRFKYAFLWTRIFFSIEYNFFFLLFLCLCCLLCVSAFL